MKHASIGISTNAGRNATLTLHFPSLSSIDIADYFADAESIDHLGYGRRFCVVNYRFSIDSDIDMLMLYADARSSSGRHDIASLARRYISYYIASSGDTLMPLYFAGGHDHREIIFKCIIGADRLRHQILKRRHAIGAHNPSSSRRSYHFSMPFAMRYDMRSG